MTDQPHDPALEDVLRMVADGQLTPDEAAPLVAELTGAETPPAPAAPRRQLRLEVLENGKRVVNLRVPAGLAASLVPGIPEPHLQRLRTALREGTVGTILEVTDEDGDGVIIATE